MSPKKEKVNCGFSIGQWVVCLHWWRVPKQKQKKKSRGSEVMGNSCEHDVYMKFTSESYLDLMKCRGDWRFWIPKCRAKAISILKIWMDPRDSIKKVLEDPKDSIKKWSMGDRSFWIPFAICHLPFAIGIAVDLSKKKTQTQTQTQKTQRDLLLIMKECKGLIWLAL